MILLSTLLVGLVCSTSLPQTALVNAAQGAHQLAPGTQIVPQDILKNNVLPYLEPDDAMNAKSWLRYSEEKIIKLFAESQPAKVAQYILRDLDNPHITREKRLQNLDTFFGANSRYSFRNEISILIANGKVDLLRDILNRNRRFSRIRFSTEECLEAVKNGHVQMVEFMLDWSDYSSDALHRLSLAAIEGSLQENQFQVFKMIVDRESYILQALQYAISRNNKTFVQYCIQKINAGLERKTVPDDWYNQSVFNMVRNFGLMDNDASSEMLQFLLNQPNWNPEIHDLLILMILAQDYPALELIRKEFIIHGSLTDEQGIPRNAGIESLDAAIRQAESTPAFQDLVETLEDWKSDILSV
jgi:hypothetical protein